MSTEESQKHELNLFSYVQVLLHWKRFLLINTIVLTVLAVAIALLLPNRYKATASILPPQNESGLGGTISQLTKGIIPSGLLGNMGASPQAFNYLVILGSRSAMEEVARRNNLVKVYGIDEGTIPEAAEILDGNCDFQIEENGNVTVSVVDEDKKLAAKMANDFVDVLNKISIELNTLEARNNREFIETRYNKMMVDLRNAEDSLQAFQQQHGVLSLPEQTKASIEAAAELKAQLTVNEIEVGVLQRTLGNTNNEVALKKAEIAELQSKLGTMLQGKTDNADAKNSMFLPLEALPEIGMQYIRLYRDFEIQNRILSIILPLYEQAKVEENKNVPVVLVLDKAVPPIRKYWPPRSIIVSVTMLTSLFLSVLLILFMEFLIAPKSGKTAIEERLDTFVAAVKRRYRIR